MSLLEEIYFGKYYFEAALIFRTSILLNSMLFNSEAWYNMTSENINILEAADESLLRRILKAPAKTPKIMLYLELGVLPIRFIIQSRRLMFLQYIMKEDRDSMIHKFLVQQLKSPTKNDWASTVIKDIVKLDLNVTFVEIEQMTKNKFSMLIKKQCNEKAIFE